MKRIATIVLTILLAAALMVLPAMAAENSTATINDVTGKPGDTVTMTVSLEGYEKVSGLAVEVNPGILEYELNWLLEGRTVENNGRYAWTVADPVNVNKGILTLTVTIPEGESFAPPYSVWVRVYTNADTNGVDTVATVGCAHEFEEVLEDVDCDTNGSRYGICKYCGEDDGTFTYVPAWGHDWEEWDVIQETTCFAPGTRTRSCKREGCDKVETENIPMNPHKFGSWVVEEYSTCTQLGTESRACTNEGCTEVQRKPIAMLDHVYQETVTAPTCENEGYTTYTCQCGDTYTDNWVDALGHNWADATCTDPKTCTVCKATEGEALGHTWADATCTDPKTCTVCKVTEGEALGHTWADATCTDPKTCTVCKVTEGEALGHTWADATCTDPKTCTVCKVTEGEALGHTWADATCTEPKTCTVCKATEGEALGHEWKTATCTEPKTCTVCKATEGEALGHDWKDATCTEPKTCEVCQETEGEELGHDWDKATCTEPKTCKVCGKEADETYGHDWKDATCTAPKTCRVCGVTEGEPLGHEFEQVPAKEPNCYELIPYLNVCKQCGHETEVEGAYVPQLPHAWGDWKVTLQPTCNEYGEKVRGCTVAECKATESAMIEPTGEHNWADATCTTPKTCEVCQETEGEALGHKWADATCTTPKTCEVCKETEGEALGHTWADATCTTPKTCEVCKETEGEALGHEWADATCTTPKTCEVCKETEGKALGHSYKATVTKPTCTAKGYTTHKCATCGDSYKDTETKALGHSWNAATCEDPKTCKTCKATEGKALGHSWNAATCTTAKTCKTCKATEGNALGHSWNAATCTTAKTCKTCKATEGKALGHSWNAATCTAAKTCKTCKATEGNALGHDMGEWKVTKEATTSKAGEKTRTCTRSGCKHSETESIGKKPSKPSSFKVSVDKTTGKATLKWKKVSGAVKYEIQRKTGKSGSYKTIATTEEISYKDTSATAGKTYYYRVRAVSKTDVKSSYCSEKSILVKLAKPDVEASNVESSGKIKLEWEKVDGAKCYRILRATSKSGKYKEIGTTTKTSYTDKDAKVGKTYYYKVVAVHKSSKANSAESSVVSKVCKLARPDVKVKLSSGDPKLSWKKISGAKEYKIYRATSKNGTYKAIKTTSKTSYTDKSVKAGKTYYYKVVAVYKSSKANSAYSSIDSIKAK